MLEVKKNIPPPVATTYDITGLTFSQIEAILDALKFASGGHFEKYHNAPFFAPSRFGTLYNSLSSKAACEFAK